MADTFKVLAQSNPALLTLTNAYTVPAATRTIVNTITVCNQNAVATTYRISVAIAGAADSTAQYIAYDTAIVGNGFTAIMLGLTLAATDIIRVYAATNTVSFNLFGMEIT